MGWGYQEGNQVYLKGQNGCLEKICPKHVSMQKRIKVKGRCSTTISFEVSGQAEKHNKIFIIKITAEKVLTC